VLYLSNRDVDELLPMPECVQVMEDLFRQEAEGLVENRPRQTLQLQTSRGSGGFHRLMMALVAGAGFFGFKSYTPSRPGGMRYYVVLHDLETGALAAFVEAKRLGELRTAHQARQGVQPQSGEPRGVRARNGRPPRHRGRTGRFG
jgi:ornithine cyclodeaminase/alanine dehydrogenase-like protein (mu-crystallin family)